MPEDLSYLLETPSKEEEQRIQEAVQKECIRAISIYLIEVANAMDLNEIQSIGSSDLRAMADELSKRLNNDENQAD